MRKPNPFAYPDKITVDSLPDLLAFHRASLGGWRMEGDGDGDGGSGDGDDKGKEYHPPATQADLDRIISDRLTREREKYADVPELRRKAAEFDKAAEAAKTEAEKAVDAARTEGAKAATDAANARIIRAEAKTLAATAKFRDPADAVAFLDLSSVTVGDDGEVDSKALSGLLDDLAKRKPYLVDDGKAGPKLDRSQGGDKGGKSSSILDLSGSDLYDRLHKKPQSA
jgi:hypothetical protein